MVRSKIRYELITDERARRVSFKKRKIGFIKQLNELKKLCNVEACAVIINGDGTQSEAWPTPPEAFQVVQKFRSHALSSQATNEVCPTRFLIQNMSRLSNNWDKENKKVQQLRMELLLAEHINKATVDVVDSNDLHGMLRLLERKIKLVNRNIAELKPSNSSVRSVAKDAETASYIEKGKQLA